MPRRRPNPRKPGNFTYYGGMIFEVDNCGRDRPRKDIGPGYRGKYKHKFFKPGRRCSR